MNQNTRTLPGMALPLAAALAMQYDKNGHARTGPHLLPRQKPDAAKTRAAKKKARQQQKAGRRAARKGR